MHQLKSGAFFKPYVLLIWIHDRHLEMFLDNSRKGVIFYLEHDNVYAILKLWTF